MSKNRISILASGDEIITGRLIDTNSAWVSQFVQKLGYQISYIGTTGDNTQKLLDMLVFVCEHSDVVIITGGLGPTEDDKTRFVLAELTNQSLVFNFIANKSMYEFYKKVNRDFSTIPVSNYVQCMLPLESTYIPNLQGTACGMACRFKDTQIISLPGVPHEMKNMLELIANKFTHILPRIGSAYFTKVMTIFGISESRLGEMIQNFMIQSDPIVGVTAKSGYIQISVMSFDEKLAIEVFKEILQIVNVYLISDEGLTPAEMLIKLCKENKWKLGAIESCTGGMISDAFVAVPGASEVFPVGVVTYSNEAKNKFANVSEQTLERYGAVSEEVVKEMAYGFATKNNLDICLSTSGVAGPDGGTVNKPVGLVCVGVYLLGETFTFSLKFGGNRQEIRIRSVFHSICLCIQKILKN